MGWQRLPISEILRKSENWVQPEPDRIYQQIRVRLWGKGLTLRAKVPGANISARRQLRASAGQFLISRIDARHGAFGIVPDHLDGALVSSDFPCFEINDHVVLPEYLEWFTRTEQFVALCRRASEGSTNRVRLKEERFMSFEIPTPSLNAQRYIAAKLTRLDQLRRSRDTEIDAMAHDIRLMLSTVFRRIVECVPYQPLKEVAPVVRRPVEIHPEKTYCELAVRSFGRGIFHKPTLLGADLTWQRLFKVQSGDIVFSNIKAWEGAFAVATRADHDYVASHRYLTCVPRADILSPEFLWYFLQSPDGMRRVESASPGSADRNRTLGQTALGRILVPTPPLEPQQWFVRLDGLVRKMEALRASESFDMDIAVMSEFRALF